MPESWNERGPGSPGGWAFTVAALSICALGLLYRLQLTPFCVPGGPVWRISDDIFYYLQIARNISLGNGATFDGISQTNGFHPLYALILTGLFKAGVSPAQMPQTALAVLAIADAVTGLFLFLILRGRGLAAGGLVACLLWMANVEAVGVSHLGVETPISAMLLATSLYAYLRWKARSDGRGRGPVAAGLLIGLAALARTDSFLMAFALGADIFLLSGRAETLKARLIRSVTPLVLAVAVVSPWFIWNLATFGTIGQVSAKALIYRQQASVWIKTAGKLESAGLTGIPAAILLGLAWLLYSLAKIPNWFIRLGGLLQPAALFWLIAGADAFLLLRSQTAKERGDWAFPELLRPVAIYLVLVGAAYGVAYHHAHLWYFQGSLMAATLLAGAAAQDAWLRAHLSWRMLASNRLVLAGIILACVMLTGTYFNQLSRPWSEMSPCRDGWHHACAKLPGDAVIGSFNSGKLGYYSERRVINLDGVVNNRAWVAIREKRLWDYMRREGIDYLVDSPRYVKEFAPFCGPDYLEGARVLSKDKDGVLYRLPWAKGQTPPIPAGKKTSP